METPDVKLNSGGILVSSRSLIAIWPDIHLRTLDQLSIGIGGVHPARHHIQLANGLSINYF
jgi:hypothetical protein